MIRPKKKAYKVVFFPDSQMGHVMYDEVRAEEVQVVTHHVDPALKALGFKLYNHR